MRASLRLFTRQLPVRSAVSLLAVLVILLLFKPATGLAQQASAGINGTVTDPSGAVIEGAEVSLTNTATSITRTATSNSTGNYVFVDVLPGDYAMRVVKPGFETLVQQQFTLYVNQTATFDFRLTVGSTQQSVTVEAAAIAIQASTAELGTVINEQAVNQLPLNGRNFTQLLALTPGASPVSVAQNAGGGGGFAGNAIGSFVFPALNGQRNRSNMFLLDGINDLGSFIGNYNFAPIVDTVQEFKVQSHNDEAAFGQAVGGIVNVVTKAGTNQFHGSLWEFLRNEKLDARNFFLAQRNPLRQNQFGAAVGGPVWIPKAYNGRNRTFFYGGYEGYRQSEATQNLLLTPTTAQLNGDFSGVSNQLYNPFSTRPDPANPGQYIRDTFPNNQIPTNLLNPAALLYARTLFPAAGTNLPGGTNFADTTPSRINQDSYHGRVDQTFSEHDTLFGRISYYNQNNTTSAGYPGAINNVALEGWNWALHETHTFNPNTVLDTRFGRNWGDNLTAKAFTLAPANFIAQLQQLGFSPNFVGNFQAGNGPFVPLIGISGYLGTGGNNVQDTRLADVWAIGADMTLIRGRHTLRFGATMNTNNTRSPIFGTSMGFAATQTQNPQNATGTGDPLASFLLGVPDNSNKRNVLEVTRGGWVHGFYFQDQWKVTDRLTLNLGVRWDVTLWPIYGQIGTPDSYVGDLNLNDGSYILANVPTACSSTQGAPCIPNGVLPPRVRLTDLTSRAIYHNDYRDWQGRGGLAYRFTDKTVLRVGYGRFYDNWNSVIQLAQNYEGAWPSVGQLLANNLNQPGGTAASIGDPFGLGSSPILPAPTPFNQVQWFIDPTGYRMPYSDQWNVSVQQQLGQNTVLSLAYVGAHDLQLNLGGYRNTATIAAPGDAAAVASRRPYPYITPTYYDQSIGQSKYNAFEFQLQQRSSKGLTYLVSYTRSKSIDVGCSGSFGAEGCNVQFPYNLNLDRSVSGFDLPNIFSGSVVYDIPVGKGRSFSTGSRFADYVVGNWQIGGIVNFYSGVPFTVTVSNGNLANTGNVVERANLVLPNSVYAANKGPNGWLNPLAFATPAPYTYGNLGRNNLRSDATKNLDLSLVRRFPIHEDIGFEFRADAFNLTNTAIFNAPNSTLGNPNFGVVTSTRNNPRQLQFALKFLF